MAGFVDPANPVYGLQPRGLDGEHEPHPSANAAADDYVPAIGAARPGGPIHLLGHSFGGWIAFEIATRLRRAGREILSVTLLDTEPPDERGAASPVYDEVGVVVRFIEILELGIERSLGIDPASLCDAPEATRLARLHAALVREGVLPARTAPDVLRGPISAFAACIRSTYTPAEAYDGTVHLVLMDDTRLDEAANRDVQARFAEQWTRWAPRITTTRAPGNHVTALRPPYVAELAKQLAPYITSS